MTVNSLARVNPSAGLPDGESGEQDRRSDDVAP
jgi:hypothetical protein